MASTWGSSWNVSWAVSWEVRTPVVIQSYPEPVQQIPSHFYDQVHVQQLNRPTVFGKNRR